MRVSSVAAVVRFAPSPTGLLHVGNARIALVNRLFASAGEGRFILRIDDTDRERSHAEYITAIKRDLRWLGLDWDSEIHQSDRLDAYDAAATVLKSLGRLYPCYETVQELELKRKRQLASGKPPVYDRAALDLGDAARARLEAEGRAPHWRFLLGPREASWQDRVRGSCTFDLASQSDPVLVRADGSYLYTLPSVVDDIDLGITDIVRGEDHVTNTAVQMHVFEALGKPPAEFAFAHVPLLTDAVGKGMSKRLGALSLESLRHDGIEAMAVNSLLARIGTKDSIEPADSVESLIGEFDLAKFGRATPKFDVSELRRLNAKVIHSFLFEDVRDRLEEEGLGAADEAFWLAVRANLATLAEATVWWQVVRGPTAPVIEDMDFASTAAELLPSGEWDERTWQAWTAQLGTATGVAGRALFRPLRLALTGLEHGPEMKALLPLIGKQRARARLQGKTM